MKTPESEPVKELTELEKLQARRAAFAAEREAKKAAIDAAEAVERERRAFEEDEALAKAQDELGFDAVELVPSLVGATIVKKPSQVLYRNFQETGKPTANSFEKLVRPCLVYPTVAQWERIIKEQPAALTDCANAVSRLAGVGHKERTEK